MQAMVCFTWGRLVDHAHCIALPSGASLFMHAHPNFPAVDIGCHSNRFLFSGNINPYLNRYERISALQPVGISAIHHRMTLTPYPLESLNVDSMACLSGDQADLTVAEDPGLALWVAIPLEGILQEGTPLMQAEGPQATALAALAADLDPFLEGDLAVLCPPHAENALLGLASQLPGTTDKACGHMLDIEHPGQHCFSAMPILLPLHSCAMLIIAFWGNV